MTARLTFLAILLLGPAGSTIGSAQPSPFLGATKANPPSAGPQTPAKFEFTGVVNLGAQALLCITEVAEQRSHWIKVGQNAAGITVVDHDPATQQTTIRHAGKELLLSLKVRSFDPSKLTAYQPLAPSGPLPSAGIADAVPLTTEAKETEARMLVSDLLEIGMIQRKAYEQAKQDEAAAPQDTTAAD